jgi:hypothetical protein
MKLWAWVHTTVPRDSTRTQSQRSELSPLKIKKFNVCVCGGVPSLPHCRDIWESLLLVLPPSILMHVSCEKRNVSSGGWEGILCYLLWELKHACNLPFSPRLFLLPSRVWGVLHASDMMDFLMNLFSQAGSKFWTWGGRNRNSILAIWQMTFSKPAWMGCCILWAIKQMYFNVHFPFDVHCSFEMFFVLVGFPHP